MDDLLDLMAMPRVDTERADIIATLFVAWNDLFIALPNVDPEDARTGTPSDDEIIAQVRERWHIAKRRFDVERLYRALGRMQERELVPSGIGPATCSEDARGGVAKCL